LGPAFAPSESFLVSGVFFVPWPAFVADVEPVSESDPFALDASPLAVAAVAFLPSASVLRRCRRQLVDRRDLRQGCDDIPEVEHGSEHAVVWIDDDLSS
jgi:hypothetical protein